MRHPPDNRLQLRHQDYFQRKERVYEFSKGIIDEITSPMLEGIAFHWYSGDHFEALELAQKASPGMKLMFLPIFCPVPPVSVFPAAMMLLSSLLFRTKMAPSSW